MQKNKHNLFKNFVCLTFILFPLRFMLSIELILDSLIMHKILAGLLKTLKYIILSYTIWKAAICIF